jgi:BolA protein
VQTSLKDQIEMTISEFFKPEFLLVEDESWQHGGGASAQSHFKIVAVCAQFEGLKLLARHRLVQESLAHIIPRVRAISLHTMTPEEWSKAQQENFKPRSPGCHNKKS